MRIAYIAILKRNKRLSDIQTYRPVLIYRWLRGPMGKCIRGTQPMGILVAFPTILLNVLVVGLPTIVFDRVLVEMKKCLKDVFGKYCGLRFLRLGRNRAQLVPQLTLLSLPIQSLLPLLFHLNLAYGISNTLHVQTPILLLGNNNTMLSAHDFHLICSHF